MLVVDIANDFLQDVLQRDDALQGAVFVDHDREMLASVLNAWSWSNSDVVSGMNQGFAETAVMSSASMSISWALSSRSSALAWTTPIMLSGSPR